MRVTLAAVGRQKSSPEAMLVTDYLTRFEKTGRALGFSDVRLVEVEDKRGAGPKGEALLLRKSLPDGALIVALDERGTTLTSPKFATSLARWRDDGTRDLAFVIGGADGLDPEMRDKAALCLSFGKMVWPHMLARVMLAEQLYRAATILSGGPYHRE